MSRADAAPPGPLDRPAPPPRLVAALALVVAAGAFALFWPTRGHAFLPYDDDVYVTAERHVTTGFSVENARWAFVTMAGGYWNPVTWFSHQADVALFGVDSGAHHLVNAAFHALNAALVLLLLVRLAGRVWPAAFAAALFAVHPLRVESVAWMSQRKDLLSTTFALAALLAYVRWARGGGRRAYVATLVLFALGLMAKPMVVSLPLLFLALDLWPLGRLRTPAARRAAWREKLPFFALSIAVGVVTVVAQKEAGSLSTLEAAPLTTRLANAATSCFVYLRQTFWPADLAVLYPFPRGTASWGEVLLLGGLLVGLTAVLVRLGRRRPWIPALWLWYLAALLPVSGLLQNGVQARADRYTYVALIGPFFLVALLGAEWAARRPRLARALAPLPVAVLAVLAWVSSRQVERWRDADTLFAHTLSVTEENGFIGQIYGTWLTDHGRPSEALPQFEVALRLFPHEPAVHMNRANALRALGRRDEALAGYRRALALDPEDALAHYNLGVALADAGDVAGAAAHYGAAIRIDPDFEWALCNLGTLHVDAGRPDEALPLLERALRLAPRDTVAMASLGSALADRGDRERAIEVLRRCLAIDPSNARARARLDSLVPGGAGD